MAGLFSHDNIEQIRAASDIVDIIGGYLPLKRAGANFTALCPFHKEKTPSFNVNAHKQIFHCFGCHKGGDVFKFVQEYENIGFVDAVRRLADRAKIPLEMDANPHAQENRHIKDQLLTIHDQLATRWQNCLANEAAGQIARDYLKKRGVSEDAIKLFRIGAAPEVWDDTVNWTKSKGFDLVTVEKAGLILKKEGGDHYYDRFRGRLMFPICDEQGRVIGFSGRVLTGDEKTAKYVNSPETPIFTKSKVFFGLDKSKRAILDAGFAIICEGQLDLIACFMGGVQNIVAPQGTAFTEQHARIIKRYVDEVVLCFDADNAGQNATVRALDSLLASGLSVRVATVPAPHDPDSFIKANGGDAFQQLIAAAPGFFDFYLNRLCAQNDATSDKGRLAILRAMAEAVQKTGNNVLIDTHAQKTALRLGVTPEAVRKEFEKIARAAKPAFTPAAPAEDKYFPSDSEADAHAAAEAAEPLAPPSKEEFQFLKLLFETDNFVEWLANTLRPEWLANPAVREIFNRRVQLHQSSQWVGISAFLNEFDQYQQIITEVLTGELVNRKVDGTRTILRKQSDFSEKQIADIVLRLRNQYFDRQLATLTQRTAQPDLTDDARLELLKQQQELRRAKQQPL